MNTLSLWLSLVLATTLPGRVVSEELRGLKYNEDATLTATVHVARQPNKEQLAVYLAIDNRYQNTIECGGQLLTAIAKGDETINLLIRFGNLRIFPSGAFSYPLVHLVADYLELPPGYDFVPQEYPIIKVSCRGWSYLQYLPLQFCQKSNLEMCNSDKVSYPYMIKKYWLGSCQC